MTVERSVPAFSHDASVGLRLMEVNLQHFKNALEIARRGHEEPAFSEECRNMFRQIVMELWMASNTSMRDIVCDGSSEAADDL
jgi:hypothetical protein